MAKDVINRTEGLRRQAQGIICLAYERGYKDGEADAEERRKEQDGELKPCPFCGGKAITRMELEPRKTMRPYGTFYTECRSCGASVGFAFVNAEDAEKAWNRRAGDERDYQRHGDAENVLRL